MSTINVEDELDAVVLLDRLKRIYGAENDSQLARAMGVGQTTVSNWRNRKIVPLQACLRTALTHGVSLDYLLLGKVDQKLDTPSQIDLNLLTKAAKELDKIRAAKVPLRAEPEWLQLARYYNSWVGYFEKRNVDYTSRSELIGVIGDSFLMLPESLLVDDESNTRSDDTTNVAD